MLILARFQTAISKIGPNLGIHLGPRMLTSLDNPISVDFFTGMGRGDI